MGFVYLSAPYWSLKTHALVHYTKWFKNSAIVKTPWNTKIEPRGNTTSVISYQEENIFKETQKTIETPKLLEECYSNHLSNSATYIYMYIFLLKYSLTCNIVLFLKSYMKNDEKYQMLMQITWIFPSNAYRPEFCCLYKYLHRVCTSTFATI